MENSTDILENNNMSSGDTNPKIDEQSQSPLEIRESTNEDFKNYTEPLEGLQESSSRPSAFLPAECNKNNKSSNNNHQHDSAIKLKRCKHGRIIIKDSSKKKSAQPQIEDAPTETQLDTSVKSLPDVGDNTQKTDKQPLAVEKEPIISQSEPEPNDILANATELTPKEQISSPTLDQVSTERQSSIKLPQKHGDELARISRSPDVIAKNHGDRSPPGLRRGRSRSRSKSRNRTRLSRDRSPIRRSKHKGSSSHRKSVSRDRNTGIRDRKYSSPSRRDRSPPSRRSRKSSRHRERYRSPVRYEYRSHHKSRSPKRRDQSPPSRSSSSSWERNNTSNRTHRRELDRGSPLREHYRQTRYPSSYEEQQPRVNTLRVSEEYKDRGIAQESNMSATCNAPKSPTSKVKYNHNNQSSMPQMPHLPRSNISAMRETLIEQSSVDPNQRVIPSARSPVTPSNESASSDIYDPEAPVIAISPGDSPPISPLSDTSPIAEVYQRPEASKNGAGGGEDDLPSSAVQLNQQEKYLQKLNRQERVIEEVKIALRPYYQNRTIDKEQYKDVLRRAVPKVCHSKKGEINPIKIRALVDAYVRKMKHLG